jgi:hypothetical protein
LKGRVYDIGNDSNRNKHVERRAGWENILGLTGFCNNRWNDAAATRDKK